MKESKDYCLKLIDELGGCYYTIDHISYNKMRKVTSLWKQGRTVIRQEGEIEILRATTGEELWIFES